MFKSINVEKTTFSKKVVEHIRELIASGYLKPGDKLPAERELSEMMNVSRPTIREAFKLLSAMGFVKIKQGNGVFVADHGDRIDNLASFLFQKTDTIQQLFEVRKIFETEAAAWSAKRGTPQFLDGIAQKTKEVYHKVMVEPDFTNAQEKDDFLSESDQQFHLMVAESTGNEIIVRIMNNLIDLLRESRMRSMKVPGRVMQSLKEHMLIAEALVERDSELARTRMFDHLSSVERDLIHEIEQHTPTAEES